MSQAHFAKAPNINIPRSKFKMPFNHCTTFNHGQLIPIDVMEILPGDTISLNLSSLIRMSTPIFPIMDSIECYIHAFFIPMRLVWEHTAEFFGENKTSAGYQVNNYVIPNTADIDEYSDGLGDFSTNPNCLCNYLGYKFESIPGVEPRNNVNTLPERAYYLVWNEWYRAQQLQDPFIVDTGDDGYIIGLCSGVNYYHACKNDSGEVSVTNPLNVCKKFDYFTAATIAPQYGAAVTLPLGSYAPIVVGNKLDTRVTNTSVVGLGVGAKGASAAIVNGDKVQALGTGYAAQYDLVADLSNATAATINSIRYAFQVQKYLERSNFGSRFFEMLAVHYGVTSPDARLQRPEYLGGTKFMININQVLSTAGYEPGSSTKVGQTGAVSVTGNKSHIFTKGFVEPGYLMVMVSTKHDQTYGQGLDRMFNKLSRFEIYSPEFANLGDQEILNKEILSDSSNPEGVFGYQEHWAEYRYRPNRVSGLCNPCVDDALEFVTLANRFDNDVILSDEFIKENRSSIARALASGESGPDYLADFYFDYTAIRELPAYSIPGLVDHFGVM